MVRGRWHVCYGSGLSIYYYYFCKLNKVRGFKCRFVSHHTTFITDITIVLAMGICGLTNTNTHTHTHTHANIVLHTESMLAL